MHPRNYHHRAAVEPTAVGRHRRPLSLILVLLLVTCTACSSPEKKEQKAKTSTPAAPLTNVYSNESVFDKVLQQVKEHPDSPIFVYHLAELYYRNGQYEEAVQNYAKVIKLEPKRGYAYLKMGTALNRLNRPKEAVPALQKAAELLPRPDLAYNNLAMAYSRLKETDKMIEALKKALAVKPKYAAARFNLGMAYLRKNDKAAATEQYQALLTFDKTMAKMLKKEIDKH